MTPGLLDHLASLLSLPADQVTVRAASGGDINRAYHLGSAGQSWFVKVNEQKYLSMFEAEQRGLELIRSSDSVRVPAVLASGVYGQSSYLVLEYIELRGSPASEDLAAALAAMHHFQVECFGNDHDNTIGLTPQRNTREDDWIRFWSQHRIGLQIELARASGLDRGLLQRLATLQSVVGYFFTDYHPLPSLLHGDLWSGNWSADSHGQPVIYDPACYFGDHEADLAMMELFGNPGEVFFRAYRERFPIDPGYRERKLLYNLYHIVNHALLFGGGYSAQASRMAGQLIKLVG